MLRMLVLLVTLWCIASNAAGDPLVVGHVYPIAEDDLLVHLKEKSADVNVAKLLRDKIAAPLAKQLTQLPEQSGLPRLDAPRVSYFTPMITVPKVGSAPMRTVPLLSQTHAFMPVLVFNAGDPIQVSWLSGALKKYPQATIIATGGNLTQAMQTVDHLIHYDRTGDWVRRFQLKGLPASITYEGGVVLTVTEGVDHA